MSSLVKAFNWRLERLLCIGDNLRRVKGEMKSIQTTDENQLVKSEIFDWIVKILRMYEKNTTHQINNILKQLTIIYTIYKEVDSYSLNESQKSSLKLAKQRIGQFLKELDKIDKKTEDWFVEEKAISIREQLLNKQRKEIERLKEQNEVYHANEKEWNIAKSLLLDAAIYGLPLCMLAVMTLSGACNSGLSLIVGITYAFILKSTLDFREAESPSYKNSNRTDDEWQDLSDKTTKIQESFDILINIELKLSGDEKNRVTYSNLDIDELSDSLAVLKTIELCENFKRDLKEMLIFD